MKICMKPSSKTCPEQATHEWSVETHQMSFILCLENSKALQQIWWTEMLLLLLVESMSEAWATCYAQWKGLHLTRGIHFPHQIGIIQIYKLKGWPKYIVEQWLQWDTKWDNFKNYPIFTLLPTCHIYSTMFKKDNPHPATMIGGLHHFMASCLYLFLISKWRCQCKCCKCLFVF